MQRSGEPRRARAMQRDSIFRIASMTKPITAAATVMLVEEAQFLAQNSSKISKDDLTNPSMLQKLRRRFLAIIANKTCKKCL